MKELFVRVAPTVFNYSGAIVEDGFLVKELTTIPRDITELQNYAIEQDCGTIVFCGNKKYTSGLKKQIEENPPIKYNQRIKVRLEEVKG